MVHDHLGGLKAHRLWSRAYLRRSRFEDEDLDLAVRRTCAVLGEAAVERGTSLERALGLGCCCGASHTGCVPVRLD